MRTESELFDAFELCSVMMDQIEFELAKIAEEKRDLPRTVKDFKMAKRIIARMIDLLAWFMGHDNEFEKRVAAFRASLLAEEDAEEDLSQKNPDFPRVKITHITEVKGSGNHRGPRTRRQRRRLKPYR